MKNCLVIGLLILSTSAFAKSKQDRDYHDALLVSFRTVTTGSVCSSSGHTNGTVDDEGNVSATTNSSGDCSNTQLRYYTVELGSNTYVLAPTHSGKSKAGAALTFGWGALAWKSSVLANEMPGSHVLLASDPSGFYVKVGNRESKFTLVEAK